MSARVPPHPHPRRVVIGATILRSLIPTNLGVALVLLELGTTTFFAAGITERAFGQHTPLLLAAALILGVGVRALDLENSALFIPGGLYGTVRHAFGRANGIVAASA